MKKTFLLFLLVLLSNFNLFAQDENNNELPKFVTEETKEELLVSKVYIPIKIPQTLFKEAIEASTPENLKSKVDCDVRDLNIGFKVSNGEIQFSKLEISHKLNLEPEAVIYRNRNKVNRGWPFKGYKFSDWQQVECKEIVASSNSSIWIKLNHNCEFISAVDVITDIDKLKCANSDIAPFATLLDFQDYKTMYNSNLEKELKKISFKNKIAGMWNELYSPAMINKKLFINKIPEKFNFKDLKFEDDLGKINIGVNFILNSNESALKASEEKMPDLIKNTERSRTQFAINMPIRYNYKDLKEKFNGKFSGQAIKGKNSRDKLKKYAKVVEIDFYGSEEDNFDIIIGLKSQMTNKLSKNQTPTIYLHAKLDYDTIRKSVFIKNFKLDELSKTMLDKNDVKPITVNAAYQKMISKFQIKIDDFVSQNKKIKKQLKKEPTIVCSNVILTDVANSIELNKVIAQPNWVYCLFNLKGQTKVNEINIEKETK